MATRAKWMILSWVCGGCLLACSPSAGDGPGAAQGPSGTQATGGSPGGAGPAAAGAPGVGGAMGSGFIVPTKEPDAGLDACKGLAVESESITIEVPVEVPVEVPYEVPVEVPVEIPYEVTEEVPKSLYIMMDRSGSMVTDPLGWLAFLCFIPGLCDPNATTPPTKWDFAKYGMEQFVDDPGSTNLKTALAYFPQGGQCDGSGYDVPVVPMGALPANAQAVKDSMNAQVPGANTPTAGALRGLIRYCEQYQAQNPNEKCVGVLMTDGAPSECEPQDAGGLAALAAQAAANDIQIFAAGMTGANFQTLNAIGQAGGGDCTPNDPATWACDLTEDQDAFLRAMQEIASQTTTRTRTETRTEIRTEYRTETRTEIRTEIQVQPVQCEWGVPDPPEGETFDPEKVNVRVTQGGVSRAVGRVPSEAECASFEGGWFYDNDVAPTKVSVCPATCELIQNVADQTVEVLFGCTSTPAVPR